MTQPLSQRENVILDILSKFPDGVAFNELCREMRGLAARQTIKNELDELIDLNLVKRTAARKGQKVLYIYKDFEKTAESVRDDLKSLADLLEDLKSRLNQIEEKVGKPLRAITRQDADNPALLKLIPEIDSFTHTALIILLTEWGYPPRLRERFKEIVKGFGELVDNFSRIVQLNRKLSQAYWNYIWRINSRKKL